MQNKKIIKNLRKANYQLRHEVRHQRELIEQLKKTKTIIVSEEVFKRSILKMSDINSEAYYTATKDPYFKPERIKEPAMITLNTKKGGSNGN